MFDPQWLVRETSVSSLSHRMSEVAEAPATARTGAPSRHRILIAAGFAIGAVFGMTGNVLPAGAPQDVAWVVSSLGLMMSSALFAAWFARRGHDIVAVGFALFALAEGVIVSGGTPTDPGGEASFAGAAALYALALLLIGVPAVLPVWTRIVGSLAAAPFGVHGLLWRLGEAPESSGPFAGAGYMLLTIAVVGWIVSVLRPVLRDR